MQFRDWIAEGRFLEWAAYSGHLYGTPKAAVDEQLAAGRDVLLEIELEGAWQVSDRCPDALMIFIRPPSFAELERRLRGRNTESDEAIAMRLEKAKEELAEVEAEMGPGGEGRFDYVIVNDSVMRARASWPAQSYEPGMRMNKPTIDEILAGLSDTREPGTEEPNRYTAVMVTAKRARQINSYYHSLGEGGGLDNFAPPLISSVSRNYLSMSMAEVARGEIGYRLRPIR